MAKVTAASKGPMDQYLHTEQVCQSERWISWMIDFKKHWKCLWYIANQADQAEDDDNDANKDYVDDDDDGDDDDDSHLKRSLTGGSGQEGWWTIGSGENQSSSNLFSWSW